MNAQNNEIELTSKNNALLSWSQKCFLHIRLFEKYSENM